MDTNEASRSRDCGVSQGQNGEPRQSREVSTRQAPPHSGQVCVLGAGTMGWGIAQLFASSGYDVLLCDRDIAFAREGKTKMAASLEKLVGKGKIGQDKADEILRNVTPALCAQATDVCFALEAIYENMAAKLDLLSELEGILPQEAVIASNTSTLSITEMGAALQNPARFAGMHFFNPPQVMKLVEVISGAHSSPETLRFITELAERVGKTTVTAQERSGFVVNRILVPMINEAVFVLDEGVASAEDIDTAMKLGANHPMGPLALGDLIGLDVVLSIMEVLLRETGDSKYRPHPLLRKMVRAGTLGRKTKQGFFSYQ